MDKRFASLSFGVCEEPYIVDHQVLIEFLRGAPFRGKHEMDINVLQSLAGRKHDV